jgi:histone-lysine N-methyltransferase SETMAR
MTIFERSVTSLKAIATVDKITSEVNISHGSAHSIIMEHLRFSKVCARWVPRLLTRNQKQAQQGICQGLLIPYEQEGNNFLHRIVSCDESWAHHYTPESKTGSVEWQRRGGHCPVKAKMRLSAGKVLTTIFWDWKGVLLVDFLHERCSVNAAYYCQLLDNVKVAYKTKRRGQPIRNWILPHDNGTSPPTAQICPLAVIICLGH